MAACVQCRSPLPNGAAFCGVCGSRVITSASASPSAPGQGGASGQATPGRTLAAPGGAAPVPPARRPASIGPTGQAQPGAGSRPAPPPPPAAGSAAARALSSARRPQPAPVPTQAPADPEAGASLDFRPPRRAPAATAVLVLLNLGFVAGGIYCLKRYFSLRAQAAEPARPVLAGAPDAGVMLASAPPTPAPLVPVRGMRIGKDQGKPVTIINPRPSSSSSPSPSPTSSPSPSTSASPSPSASASVSPSASPSPSATATPSPTPAISVDAALPPPATPDAGPTEVAPSPSPTAAPEPARPPIDTDELDRVFRRGADSVGSCYTRYQKQNPKLEGDIEIVFRIDANGRAKVTRVAKNSTGSDGLADCVGALIETWDFPKPVSGEVPIQWPFTFHPVE